MAVYAVLVDANVLRNITAYQRGLPVAILDFMRANPFDTSHREACGQLIRKAIDTGDLRLLQLLHRYFVVPKEQRARINFSRHYIGFRHVWLYAVKHGDDSILAWLKTQPHLLASDTYELLLRAIDVDNRDIVAWVLRAIPWKIKHTLRAAKSGHLALLQWLDAREPTGSIKIPFSIEVMDVAATHGHLELVKYLHEHRSEGCTMKAMDETRSFEVLKFLHDHRTEGCTTKAMDVAASHGQLDMVQFLHEHRSEGCTTDAMNEAATNGHLAVVQYLHEHRTEGCTVRAMNGAARHGHLKIVQFLHEHRTEGCTAGAMDGAAYCGHFDVVKFLHHHRTEGCSADCLRAVASRGTVEVAEFLIEHYPFVKNSKTAIDTAAYYGHLDMIKCLHKHLPHGCSSDAMDSAARLGRLDIIKFLRENRTEGCSSTAMWFAVNRGDLAIACYLREQCAARCDWVIVNAARRGDLAMVQYLGTMPTSSYLVEAERAAIDAGFPAVAEYLAELKRK